MMAHDLLSTVATMTGARSCLVLTSSRTGNPFLRGVSVGQFEALVSLQYDGAPDRPGDGFPPVEVVTRVTKRLGQFDVGFVDPFHSYSSSLRVLDAFARRTRRGWLVAHDCYPLYELSAEQYQIGAWCGSTYAAFRDVASSSNRAWFVVDDDYGLGVIGPKNTGRLIRHDLAPELAARWSRADIATKRELFKEHGPQVMRLVSPERAEELLTQLIRGESVTLQADS